MLKKSLVLIATLLVLFSCGQKDSVAPKVIATNPPNGAQDVDPAITEISVTFNEAMLDKNWSWCYEQEDQFPEKTNEPYYTDGYTRNVLPVRLEPGKEYVIWINTKKINAFKDKAGNSAIPYKFTFKTK